MKHASSSPPIGVWQARPDYSSRFYHNGGRPQGKPANALRALFAQSSVFGGRVSPGLAELFPEAPPSGLEGESSPRSGAIWNPSFEVRTARG
jgi:hypothetical protein